jgi:hypothetical protein
VPVSDPAPPATAPSGSGEPKKDTPGTPPDAV